MERQMSQRFLAICIVLICGYTTLAADRKPPTSSAGAKTTTVMPAESPRCSGRSSGPAECNIASAGPCEAECRKQQEKGVLLKQKLSELERLQREIRQLRAETGTGSQIVVRVQMLEVSLSKL